MQLPALCPRVSFDSEEPLVNITSAQVALLVGIVPQLEDCEAGEVGGMVWGMESMSGGPLGGDLQPQLLELPERRGVGAPVAAVGRPERAGRKPCILGKPLARDSALENPEPQLLDAMSDGRHRVTMGHENDPCQEGHSNEISAAGRRPHAPHMPYKPPKLSPDASEFARKVHAYLMEGGGLAVKSWGATCVSLSRVIPMIFWACKGHENDP